MYWFHAHNPLIFLLWLAVAGFWSVGGWLLATHAFNLEARERLLIGLGLGLVLYLWLVNWLGRIADPTLAFLLSAIIVLFLGLAFAWRGERPLLAIADLGIWKWLVVGLILAWLIQRVAMGMAIFDEPKNLSIVSTMAAGDIPPHHYMNVDVLFPYHYGFQLLGASLVRLGGLFPWSALDLSKAFLGAYFFLLAALFARRFIENRWAGAILAGALALAAGTRYLLYLLPRGFLATLDEVIKVRAPDAVVGLPLSQAILQGILIDDGPPAPFLYGFIDGIGWPFVMNIQIGPSTLSLILLFLAWLLSERMKRRASWLLLVLLFSFWALVWESSYGAFLIGALLSAAYWYLHKRGKVESWIKWTAVALLVSIPFALFQGGTITELFRGILGMFGQPGPASSSGAAGVAGFSLRWPLAIYSRQLGALEIFSGKELLVAFFEIGPVIFLAPWITWYAWKRLQAGDWMTFAVAVSAWTSFLLPVLLSFEYDRDIVRFTEYSRWIWIILLVIQLFDFALSPGRLIRYAGVACLALMMLSGVAVASSTLSAATQYVLTEKDVVGGLDALVAQDVWDRLASDGLVFDPQGWRATMLTGRLTRVVEGNMSYNYTRSSEWEALRDDPSSDRMLKSGFDYVYIQDAWWDEISPEARGSLSAQCVQIVTEHKDESSGEFRRLIDLSGCNS